MVSFFGRARRQLSRCAAAALALVFAGGLVAPVTSAAATPRIVAVSVTGNAHVPSDRIMAVVKARVGDSFDPKVVQQDLQNISALGYFGQQVPPLIRQRPGGVAITYRVIENPVITRVTFSGNTHVPADTLLALMDTSVGQVLNTNTFKQDVLKINSYYDKIGYGGQLPTHVKDLNIDAASGALTIAIQEGLTVRNVLIAGDPLLRPSLILGALSVKPGTEYSEAARDKDFQTLQDLYKRYDLVLGDAEAGIDPATIDLKAGTADVRYTLRAARVGAIQITGNTKTKDEVIRRELRLRPGMYITQSALERDRDRLNNTGFFEKVNLNVKAGPDPKNAALVTLDWDVKEQRTGTATVGFGYSGGIAGQGLTGTLAYSNSNVNGTGNGLSFRFEKGARTSDLQASFTIPYVGKTPRSQRYSLGGTIFANSQSYFYPVYPATPATGAAPAPAGFTPVTLFPSNSVTAIPNVLANAISKSSGIALTLGRRINDYTRGSVGVNVQRVISSTKLPFGFYFPSAPPSQLTGPGSTFGGAQATGTFGIIAPSIANINSGQPFKLHSLVFGLQRDTRDDIFNPVSGINVSLGEEVSSHGIGSDFNYTKTTLDMARFVPLHKRRATLGLHSLLGTTTGAIPPNSLFYLSDQGQLRGYNSVFYGTDIVLLQAELRIPLSTERHFAVALFGDDGGYRIRGAAPTVNPFTNHIIGFPGRWTFLGDVGVGLRFDVPQFGLRTIRIDFARGQFGSHTTFGIGQSF